MNKTVFNNQKILIEKTKDKSTRTKEKNQKLGGLTIGAQQKQSNKFNSYPQYLYSDQMQQWNYTDHLQLSQQDFYPQNRAQNSGNLAVLFVGNLDYRLKEQDIFGIFCKFGEILDIRMGVTPQGQKKGFCHVEFADDQSAFNATCMDKMPINGRQMKVDIAPKQKTNYHRPEKKVVQLPYTFNLNQGSQETQSYGNQPETNTSGNNETKVDESSHRQKSLSHIW